MPILRVNITIPNAFLADRGPISSNTLHFDSGAVALDTAAAAPIATAMGNAWTAISEHFSSGASTTATIHCYDLSDTVPRTPILVGEVPLTPGADTLPGECAVNVSYRALRETGVPSQRYRGATQLGPMATTALDEATGRVSGGCISDIIAAWQTMLTAVDTADFVWVVGSIASGWRPVSEAKIVNEFGTVGSRQMTANAGAAITLP